MSRLLRVLDDRAAVAEQTAWLLLDAVTAGGQIALAGGSTPRDAYAIAAEQDVDWSLATLWFGDERCVDPADEDSNFRIVERSLLSALPAERAPTVRRMHGEDGPDAGAEAYAAELTEELGERPALDLVLLGLGGDAHCASLFPGKPEWRVGDRSVVGVAEPGLAPWVPRISLTLPALNAARHVVFVIAGADKAEAVERVFGPLPDLASPAVHVSAPAVTVLLDPPAARRLP